MQALFVHTADNHLGYEQYGMKERFNDFSRAFWAIVDDAIARKADLFVIAGDLFNKRAIDARTLMHAQDGLERLRDAGIPAWPSRATTTAAITATGSHGWSFSAGRTS